MNINHQLTYLSNQFNDPRIVNTYNLKNPVDGYDHFYINLAKELHAQTILDIGCGTGLLTFELARQGFTMIGVEPAKPMLDIARKNSLADKVTWVQGTASSLQNYNADLAIMTGHVAQFHLTDEEWKESLNGIHNALKPGGYLSFESRNPAVQPWMNRKNHVDWSTEGKPQIVIDPTYGEMKSWMKFIRYENNRMRYELHYYFTKTNDEVVSVNELRFRTQEELSKSLTEAGFVVKRVFGNWDKSTVSAESPEFIFVAERI